MEKPVGLDRLLLTLRNALRLDRLQRENRELQRYWRDELALIGDSAGHARRCARSSSARRPSDVPILILGENGTGKELVARAVHDLSPRRAQPFVKMNCAAVPAELVESELFGHEKGAFSGAVAQRRGRFEQADGGTLFLDEIGDMAAPCRPSSCACSRTARSRAWAAPARSRWTCASSPPPTATSTRCWREGRFREDLYYRINTVTMRTPPLREHAADIPALAAHFVAAAARRNHWKPRRLCRGRPGAAAPAALEGQRARAAQRGGARAHPVRRGSDRRRRRARRRCRAARPPRRRTGGRRRPTKARSRDLVDAYERDVIRERLRALGGHVTNAARSLGLERSHLYKKCRQLGIDIREEG